VVQNWQFISTMLLEIQHGGQLPSGKFKQEGLAVARIVRDDGSSSTNLSPAINQLCGTHFYVTHFTHVSYANSVTRFIRRQYTYNVAPF